MNRFFTFFIYSILNLQLIFVSSAAPFSEMTAPQDIKQSGLERQVNISSGIGRIELRWTRDSEALFGKTPERATIEAANAVAKALKQSSLPSHIKSLNPGWKIIFLGKNVKAGQIPEFLIGNCHPGWMTPPANIYVASEQVAGGCGGSPAMAGKVADSELARVLIHEMGHAVEFALVPNLPIERARSEGFATWFEIFAGRYSGLVDSAALLNQQKLLARQRSLYKSNEFFGSAADYAFAGSFFHIVTENRSVSDLSRIYSFISNDRVNFLSALLKVTGWTEKQLNEKLNNFLNR